MISDVQDPIRALAEKELSGAPTPSSDPYRAMAEAELSKGGGLPSSFASGAMESVADPLVGSGAMSDALRRKFPWMNALDIGSGPSVYSTAGEAVRSAEPTVSPDTQNSLAGKVAHGLGNVAGFIGQTALVPGGALAKTGFAATSMGSGAFGQGQERALQAGVSQSDADKAGWLNVPAGVLMATIPGRVGAMLQNAEKIIPAPVLAKMATEGVTFAATAAGANVWSEKIQQSITNEDDANKLIEAATNGSLPNFIVGAALGAGMKWKANQNAKLSERGNADVQTAANEAAANLAKSPEATPTSEVAPVEGEAPAPKSTRIEVPDEATQGAVDRFKRDAKQKNAEWEIHEAPEQARNDVAKLGAKIVEVASPDGSPLPVPGFYDRESKTIVLDKNAEGADRRSELLLHEIVHYAEKEHPELAAEWKKALDEHAPGWAEKTGKATSAERKKLSLPRLSKAAQAEEGRAEGAEGLNLTMRLVRSDPESIAKVAQFKPGLFRTLVDTSIRFARVLKLTDRVTVNDQIRGLEKLYAEHGSELERKIGPEKATKLAFKLRDLHEAMAAETPSEQPRANEKPQPIKPSEPMGGNGEDIPPEPAFNPGDEKLTSRENLKKGMSADDAARAMDAIDRRIENALVRGDEPTTPRLRQLARDRSTAEKLLYEADPNHPSLSKEDPLSLWDRIVKDDEARAAEKKAEQAKLDKERGRRVDSKVKEIDAEEKRIAKERQRAAMKRAAELERKFQEGLKRVEAEDKKAAAKQSRDEAKAKRDAERAAAKEAKKPKLKEKYDRHATRRAWEAWKAQPDTPERGPEPERPHQETSTAPVVVKTSESKVEQPAPKKNLPVTPRRSPIERSRVQDPILGAHLEGMASEAGVHQAGGEKMVAPEYREPGVNYARMKRIPKSDWWNDRPARYETYREKETKDIVRRARVNEPLTPKEQEYVNWMLDRAEDVLYGPSATPEDIQKARDFYLEGSGMRTEPSEDAPFALPKKRMTDAEIEQRIKDEMAAQEKLDIVHASTYRKTLDRVYADKDNPEKFRGRTPYGERVEAFAKANSSNPVDRDRIRFALHTGDPLSGMTDREGALIRLFVERENSMTQAERDQMPKFEMKPSATVQAYLAERKVQNDWIGAFRDALRAGSSDAEAAKVANEAFPGALRPARFLAGLESPAFALPKKKGDGGDLSDERLRDFLKNYQMLEGDRTHYAVRSGGKATNDLHAAVESVWQKEERRMAQTERAARELLASKAGKDAVDAFVRGEGHDVPRGEEADYIVAGETRTSAMLRAAKNGTTSAKKAIDYAVDFKMMRSQHGYNLQAVKRPRTPVEKFYEAISNPSARDDLELRTVQKKLAKEKDPEKIAELKARIEEVKTREAARFERGMFALKKAGIDPDDIKSNVGAASALRVWGHNASTGMDYLLELRATSMVSSPSTSFAALGGNVANVAWNSVLLRLAELPVKGGASKGEVHAILAALPNALNEASRAFVEVWRRDMPVYELGLQDKRLIEKAEAFENAHLSAIPEKYGGVWVRRLGLTPMTAVDEFARALGTNLEVAGLAHRRSGGDPVKMAEAMADPEIWEEAVKNTRRNIFQEQENNPLVEAGLVMRDAFDRATGALPVKGKKSIPIIPAGRLTLPFVRTGVNGVLEGLRKLPVLAEVPTLSHMYHGEWKNNPELRARDIGRFFVSAAIGVTAWQLANLRDKDGVPFITGSEPHNPAYRSLGQRTAPAHSFRNPFVNDGQWYSYSKMMPFALVLSSMVDMAQRMNPWEMAKNTAGDALDSTFLRTIGGMYDFVTSDAPIDERRDKALRDFATSFVPNAVSGAMRAKDDKVHTDALRKDDSGKNTLLAGAASRLGFGDTAIRYDSWGRPIEKGGSFISRYISPTPPSGKTDDVHIADRVIQAWNAHVPEGHTPWAPSDPPYSYRSRGVQHYMSQKQFEEFQKRAGEIASSMLNERSLDPQHPTKQQIERIKKVISRSRIQARREVLRDIPIDEDIE